MGNKEKSWEKRLNGQTDPLAVDFVESLSYDKRLYAYDIAGSIAHGRMLCGQGLITADEFAKIEAGLKEIEQEISAGQFDFDESLEDVHMAIEAGLIEKIGDAGKKLHTGRSRNDQVATDVRLWMADEIDNLQEKLTNLQKAFVDLAEQYTDAIMPSYTHLQRAQPVVIASYLLSFVEKFERDVIRLANCKNLLNVSPLGSGAVAGSTLGLDRNATAKELGFAEVSRNSIDSVADRDFCAEFIFDCSLVATHLSKLAEDFIIYSSSEFAAVSIDDAFCTSSSMMPQKRNPDMLELIRGKTGSVYGSLMAILTILKAQPSTYNRDLQEDKIHIFAAADTTSACVDMAAAIVANTKFNTDKIAAGIDEGFGDATSLAEYLVAKGAAFREAHGIVGALVADCEKQNKKLAEYGLDELQKHCDKIEKDVFEHLGAANVVKKYATAGAGGSEQAKVQIKFWKKHLS